ncbi:MFS transporter [Massilia agri]|uniref:MFS transporter n=1 Tax=Massilia agri TaxID=1886785 RepID=A0ABT2AT44_9BURK|nr:MFS transporter [Massilia agri]MCS0599408.1 MFS transporter [Massilia agri]
MPARDRQQAGRGKPGTLDWRMILPVFAVVSLVAAGMSCVMPVLPFLVRDMGGSPTVIGIVIAVEALSQFCSAPLLGQLADRFGRKRILLASQILAAASLLLLSSAPNIAVILFARLLFGLSAGNLAAAAAYVTEHSDARDRRQAIGIVMGGVGLGGIVGAGLAGQLSGASLTRPVHAALLSTLLAAVLTFVLLRDSRPAPHLDTGAGTGTAGGKISLRALLDTPAVRLLIGVMLCHFFAYGMVISQLPVFLADTFVWNGHPFGPKELSYLMMADGVVNVLVQILVLGWLSRRFTERTLIVLIFAVSGAGFLAAGLATSIPVLAFAVVCVGAADALAKPTYLAALSVHVPAQRQGVVMGSVQALIAVADAASPVVGGFILGYALYGVWIGVALAVALTGAVVTLARLQVDKAGYLTKPGAG